MTKNKKFKFFLLSLLIITIIFSLFAFKVKLLQLVDFKKDKIIWQQQVKNKDEFNIEYLHSVAKTPVIEFFEIKDGKILLTGTEYYSYGAGLPTEAKQGEYILKDDKFIIKNINQILPEILLRVSDYAKHEFNFKEQNYKLHKNLKTETLIEIKIKQISYFRFYKKEVLKWLKKNI